MLLISENHCVMVHWRLTRKLQLLACHGLECHREVERRDGDLRHLLERHNEAFLRNSHIVDPYTSYGEVRVGFGNVIPHCVQCVSELVSMSILEVCLQIVKDEY